MSNRFLVCDDDYFAVKHIAGLLKEIVPDCKVMETTDPRIALDFLLEKPVDFAFIDINMPILSGDELIKDVLKQKPYLNIVIISGYDDLLLKTLPFDLSGYIQKPVSKERLLHVLENPRLKKDSVKPFKVQCFGEFEVYYNDMPLTAFVKQKKAVQLFAVLIDMNGSSSIGELELRLYEEYGESQYKNVMRLKDDLINAFAMLGFNDVIGYVNRKVFISRKELFDVDYYNYLNCEKDAVCHFTGAYMEGYAWAEECGTKAWLIDHHSEFISRI